MDAFYPPASVLHGTCGWTDESLAKSGWFPAACTSSLDRLRHFSRHFPCVEVDTSTYAIPAPEATCKWAEVTPANFKFHVKAFGIFCGAAVSSNALPRATRALPCMAAASGQKVSFKELPSLARDDLWERFHAALAPLRRAGKCGLIVFQFHNSFPPSPTNREIVEGCRRRLGPLLQMAVEFRNRTWFEDANLPTTLEWLRTMGGDGGVTLIAADDLAHEMFQPDRMQQPLPPGELPERLPIAFHVTSPKAVYVRIHRRQGKHRLLSEAEQRDWITRLRPSDLLSQGLRGPVYFLWGNSWQDQPIKSAQSLAERLSAEAQAAPRSTVCDDAAGGLLSHGTRWQENALTAWQRRLREHAPKSSLLGMLRAVPLKQAGMAAAAAGTAAAGTAAAGTTTAAVDGAAGEPTGQARVGAPAQASETVPAPATPATASAPVLPSPIPPVALPSPTPPVALPAPAPVPMATVSAASADVDREWARRAQLFNGVHPMGPVTAATHSNASRSGMPAGQAPSSPGSGASSAQGKKRKAASQPASGQLKLSAFFKQ